MPNRKIAYTLLQTIYVLNFFIGLYVFVKVVGTSSWLGTLPFPWAVAVFGPLTILGLVLVGRKLEVFAFTPEELTRFAGRAENRKKRQKLADAYFKQTGQRAPWDNDNSFRD